MTITRPPTPVPSQFGAARPSCPSTGTWRSPSIMLCGPAPAGGSRHTAYPSPGGSGPQAGASRARRPGSLRRRNASRPSPRQDGHDARRARLGGGGPTPHNRVQRAHEGASRRGRRRASVLDLVCEQIRLAELLDAARVVKPTPSAFIGGQGLLQTGDTLRNMSRSRVDVPQRSHGAECRS
jgi:hypothetical protein